MGWPGEDPIVDDPPPIRLAPPASPGRAAARAAKVMASNVHMFLEEPVSALCRWLAAMRPGGLIAITYQSRKRGATDADSASGAERIAADLRAAGFTEVRIEILEMKPVNAACVLARRPG